MFTKLEILIPNVNHGMDNFNKLAKTITWKKQFKFIEMR